MLGAVWPTMMALRGFYVLCLYALRGYDYAYVQCMNAIIFYVLFGNVCLFYVLFGRPPDNLWICLFAIFITSGALRKIVLARYSS
jgi:hypothetical protein